MSSPSNAQWVPSVTPLTARSTGSAVFDTPRSTPTGLRIGTLDTAASGGLNDPLQAWPAPVYEHQPSRTPLTGRSSGSPPQTARSGRSSRRASAEAQQGILDAQLTGSDAPQFTPRGTPRDSQRLPLGVRPAEPSYATARQECWGPGYQSPQQTARSCTESWSMTPCSTQGDSVGSPRSGSASDEAQMLPPPDSRYEHQGYLGHAEPSLNDQMLAMIHEITTKNMREFTRELEVMRHVISFENEKLKENMVRLTTEQTALQNANRELSRALLESPTRLETNGQDDGKSSWCSAPRQVHSVSWRICNVGVSHPGNGMRRHATSRQNFTVAQLPGVELALTFCSEASTGGLASKSSCCSLELHVLGLGCHGLRLHAGVRLAFEGGETLKAEKHPATAASANVTLQGSEGRAVCVAAWPKDGESKIAGILCEAQIAVLGSHVEFETEWDATAGTQSDKENESYQEKI